MKLFEKVSVLLSVKTDEELMLLVMQNHSTARKAFEVLYGRYKRPIMSYIYSVTLNSNQTEDLTQETFLKLYRSRESYQTTAKFSTYLWTIAKHTSFDYLSKKKEYLHTLDEPHEELVDSVDESPLADELLAREVDEARVRDCLARLSPRARQIVNLRIFSDESYESISQITSEPEGTIKTVLHRSKISLMDCFKRSRL